MTDPVIRIVDDDPHMHDALQFVLESEGYSVRHFFSAEDFLAGDFLSDPGCAVLDVRMGKMSLSSLLIVSSTGTPSFGNSLIY